MTPQTNFRKLFFNFPKFSDLSELVAGSMHYNSVEKVWECNICGMSNQDKSRIRRHTEIHFPGFVHTCPQCGIQKKSSTALRMHVHAYHTNKYKQI